MRKLELQTIEISPAIAAEIGELSRRLVAKTSAKRQWQTLLRACPDFDVQAIALLETGQVYDANVAAFVVALWGVVGAIDLLGDIARMELISALDQHVPGLGELIASIFKFRSLP